MCGIIGFNWEDKNLLKRSCKLLVHRGPDQFGYYHDKNISLGHRRLSIIDLSENGKQPMSNEDNSIWITYNGEIYNFQELREELEIRGHVFKSNTDTEVIVHSYEEWGKDCVNRFNGMFAFAIWNSEKKELFIARDRFGVKPLFYYFKDGRFIFASEIKGILAYDQFEKSINYEAVNQFVTFGYICSPLTIFNYIYQLPPGNLLTLKDKKINIKRYWDLEFNEKIKNEEAAIKELEIIFSDSVNKRTISDVPLGVFLSGGLDSSLVASVMKNYTKRLKTFSIGFYDSEFNETNYAQKVSEYLGTEHKEFFVKPDAVEVLPEIIYSFDQPFADPSSLPTYYLSKMTRKYVTVALSGDGADESFAGYRRYMGVYLENKIRFIPSIIRKSIRFIPATRKRYDPAKYIEKLLEGIKLEDKEKHIFYMQHFDKENRKELYSNKLNDFDPNKHFKEHLMRIDSKKKLDIAQGLDIKTYLPDDILAKVDRMSMAHSLEIRSPFMDFRMFKVAASLPTNLRLNKLNGKYVLKKFAKKYLPKEIVYRKKEGFSVPLGKWFDNELKDLTQNILLSEESLKRGYFRERAIKKILEDHIGRRKEYSTQLWILLNLEIWHRMFIDNHKIVKELNKLI